MRVKFLLVWLLVCAAVQPLKAAPSLVFDARSGEVLLAQEAGEAWHPASLTKLMTTYLTFHAIKVGRLTLDQKIIISKRAAKEPPSKLGMKPGSQISVDFAISYLLVRSGNDIAVALAEAVAGDVENFVALMNAAAQKLGMTATHFVNPHGLHDPAQVTTARDMGLLAATLVHEFPEYRTFLSKPFVKVGKKKLRNRNRLIGRMDGADGMKTGFVCASGFNLVASATRQGRQLIAVVMGHKSAPARTEAAELLLEASFAKNGEAYLGQGGRITQIENVPGAPQNMREDVCKRLGVKLIKPSEANGWGVQLGKFKNLSIADALRWWRSCWKTARNCRQIWCVCNRLRLNERLGCTPDLAGSRRQGRQMLGAWFRYAKGPRPLGGRVAQHVEANPAGIPLVPRRQPAPIAALLAIPFAATKGT